MVIQVMADKTGIPYPIIAAQFDRSASSRLFPRLAGYLKAIITGPGRLPWIA